MKRDAFKCFPHFTLQEFERSATARKYGIRNDLPSYLLSNAFLTFSALEIIRALHGHPVKITSGYRSDIVNHLVNGDPRSLHMQGLACDITEVDLLHLYSVVKSFKSFGSYVNKDRSYIHFQINF